MCDASTPSLPIHLPTTPLHLSCTAPCGLDVHERLGVQAAIKRHTNTTAHSRDPRTPIMSACRLDVYEKLGGQAAIERHTNTLRDWLAEQLPALRHSNGAPLLRVLGHDGSHTMGATFNFQVGAWGSTVQYTGGGAVPNCACATPWKWEHLQFPGVGWVLESGCVRWPAGSPASASC